MNYQNIEQVKVATGAMVELVSMFYKTCIENGLPESVAVELSKHYLDKCFLQKLG